MPSLATPGRSGFLTEADISAPQIGVRVVVCQARILAFLAALPACDVALEACSSSHYSDREISPLDHQVRLITPNYLKFR